MTFWREQVLLAWYKYLGLGFAFVSGGSSAVHGCFFWTWRLSYSSVQHQLVHLYYTRSFVLAWCYLPSSSPCSSLHFLFLRLLRTSFQSEYCLLSYEMLLFRCANFLQTYLATNPSSNSDSAVHTWLVHSCNPNSIGANGWSWPFYLCQQQLAFLLD